jgi:hypothetical protein
MDAVSSVIAISGAVVSIGNAISQLQAFVSQVKSVDKNVSSLMDEFSLLDALLKAIKTNLDSSSPQEGSGVDTLDLWVVIESSVRDCEETVEKLNEVLEGLSENGGNAYQNLVKHLKFKSKLDSIGKLRQKVQLYISVFRTAASSLTV